MKQIFEYIDEQLPILIIINAPTLNGKRCKQKQPNLFDERDWVTTIILFKGRSGPRIVVVTVLKQ